LGVAIYLPCCAFNCLLAISFAFLWHVSAAITAAAAAAATGTAATFAAGATAAASGVSTKLSCSFSWLLSGCFVLFCFAFLCWPLFAFFVLIWLCVILHHKTHKAQCSDQGRHSPMQLHFVVAGSRL